MLQRFSRLRTGCAALAAGALVASLLGVGATTATATTDTPDERSRVTVCVGEALTDRGFTDVSDNHIFHDAINCLAYYGVTVGSGDGTTFAPDQPVNRWQMMLFLVRATVSANISLSAVQAQNFTDVGDLIPEAQDAIDLLVTNGIATPKSARTFEPHAIVDRAEMALLLIRLLDAAGSVVDFNSNGDILLDANGDGSQSQPDDFFQDAEDIVPVSTNEAISAAYELGITTGADPTTASGAAQPGLDFFYRPKGSVTRGQMAAFILRTLAHTLARPTGVSAQYDGSEIRVSVRGEDFAPVSDAPIDLFYIETADATRAFDSRRACADVEFVDGAYLCEIDSSDLVTDEEGELSLTVPQPILDGTDTTVWVWTGRDGDVVARGTELARLAVEASSQAQAATQAKVSTPFKGTKARFGTTVTFTVQLQDSGGSDVSVGVDGERPAEWELTEELLVETTVDGDTDDQDERLLSKAPRTVRSDSRGRVTFSLSVSDPDRSSIGQSRTRTYKLVPGTNAPIAFVADRDFDDAHYLEFSDAPSDVEQAVVTLTTPNSYINAPSGGSPRNTAVVSVFDAYGVAVSSATASLASDKSTISSQTFTVGRDGTHRFSYSYDGVGGEIETLTATVDPDGTDSTLNSTTETAYVFWPALTFTQDTNTATYVILFGDTDRNEIIVDAEDSRAGADWPVGSDPNFPDTVPERVVYDNNDRFDVQGTNDSEPRPVSSIDEFEKALAEFLAITPEDDDGTGACLEWTSYDPGRSRFVAEFRLWRDCS